MNCLLFLKTLLACLKPILAIFLTVVEEVPQNMYRIPSAEENIFMEVPQKIPIYTFSATLGHNYIDSVLKSEEIEGD